VRRLVQRGHAVTVLAEDSVAFEVRSTGAVLRRWTRAPNRRDRRPENDPARDWECKYPWQLINRLSRTLFVGPAPRYASDMSEAISEIQPALVVCSMFCVGGMVAAEAAGVPFDVLLPNIYPLPAPGMPPFGIGLQPARGVLGRLRDRALNGIIERLWDAHALPGVNALRHQLGLQALAHFLDEFRGARRLLVLTSADFDFPAALPSHARYVGPVLDDPVWSQQDSWTLPQEKDPLVLVSMSSTFQDHVGCLQRVIDALGTMQVRVVVTTGPAVDRAALQPAANTTIVSSAPHGEVLRHTALAVSHGGHGTVMKALAAGVPLVLLPHGRDQADTAARVTARGAGVTVTRTAGVNEIARTVRRVLDNPSYRAAARRLGEVIRRDAQADVLVRELEDIPHGHGRDDASRSRSIQGPALSTRRADVLRRDLRDSVSCSEFSCVTNPSPTSLS